MKYCPHCGENMSDGEYVHHGCSVLSTFVLVAADEPAEASIFRDDGLPGSMSIDEMIGGPEDTFY